MNLAEKSRPAVTNAVQRNAMLHSDVAAEIALAPGFMAIPIVYAPDLEFDYPAGGAVTNRCARGA